MREQEARIPGMGKKIKELRSSQGMTQSQLADKIGAATSVIGNYEAELRTPTYDNLIKLSRVLEVSTDYLLGFDK